MVFSTTIPKQKQKKETMEFYGHYYLLENFGFRWTYPTLEFEYNIMLSSDKKSS